MSNKTIRLWEAVLDEAKRPRIQNGKPHVPWPPQKAVVVRVAVALNQDPRDWLAMAGHGELPEATLRALIERNRESSKRSTEASTSRDWYERRGSAERFALRERLRNKALLGCVFYLSPPRGVSDMEPPRLTELIREQNSYLALCFPDLSWSQKAHPALYRQAKVLGDEVILTWRRLYKHSIPGISRRLRVLRVCPAAGHLLVPPPDPLNHRIVLWKEDCSHASCLEPEQASDCFRLQAWYWQDGHDTVREPTRPRESEYLEPWRDLFGDLLVSWQKWISKDKSGDWIPTTATGQIRFEEAQADGGAGL